MPDYIWDEQDIYIRAIISAPSGKMLFDGRSKAKAISENGVPSHAAALVNME